MVIYNWQFGLAPLWPPSHVKYRKQPDAGVTSPLVPQVVLDEHSVSKGYGFVHFETQESADMAIVKVNGMLLNDKKV